MREDDRRVDRVRELLAPSFDMKAALGPLVAFSGTVHQVHVHISAGWETAGAAASAGRSTGEAEDAERSRRLMGIAARLRSVAGGERKMAAYLRREFGKAEPADLFGPDLERLYAWVHSLPRGGPL